MRIILHREVPDDTHLQAQWNALIDQMESAEVFYTYEWACAMQRAYASALVPFLVLGYEGENLIGVGSLATDPEQHTGSFLAGTTADYCDFLSHPSQRNQLVTAAFSELAKAGVRKIALANVPADSATVAALHAAAPMSGYRAYMRPAYLCAQLKLGTGDARMALKTTHVRKHMFRRSMNRLAKEGPVVLNHARTWREIEPILPSFSIAHVARFLATGRISNLAKASRRLFLEELAKAMSSSGWVTLTRLMAGEHAIAWNYGFQFRGSWFWYQPTFDTRQEALSPGFCLLTEIVSQACDDKKMQVVDLGLGAEGYKDRFANSTRATLHSTLDASLPRYMTTITRYRLAGFVKSFPPLDSMIRRVLSRLAGVRQRLRTSGLRGVVHWAGRRFWQRMSRRDEVFFYSWPGDALPGSGPAAFFQLVPASLEILAMTAIRYEDDTETHDYLLRAASRLRSGKSRGFALLDGDGVPVHLCWVSEFEGFFMDELNTRLTAPAPSADLIFDCWTPHAVRGRNYYAVTVGRVAQGLAREGRDAWIFSASTNAASVRGLEASGFVRRYSMLRRRVLTFETRTKVASSVSQPAEAVLRS